MTTAPKQDDDVGVERDVASDASREPKPVRDRRRSWAETVSVVIALLSLATAVFFNALQVRGGTEQARLARVTAQLQLLTSLGTTYSEARNSGTNSRGALSLIGSGARISYDSPLWPAIQRELTLAAQYAYIVTHGYLTLPGAVPIGALVCTWRWALAVEPLDAAEYMYRSNDQSNLKAFVNSHPGNYLCTEPRLP